MKQTNNAVTITGSGKICAVVNGKPFTIDSTHKNYDRVLQAVRESNWEVIETLLDISKKIIKYAGKNGVSVVGGQVLVNGVVVHNYITNRIIAFMNDGLPSEPIIRFLENLLENSSKTAVDELFLFAEVGEMAITEDGYFLAFKNVRENYFDIHSNKFRNKVGDNPTMPRNEVDDNRNRTCSNGLHFCSIGYIPMFNHSDGGHTMIVKINPRDVVSIPSDYNNTKGRCSSYLVIAEYTEDWNQKIKDNNNGFDSSLYDNKGMAVEPSKKKVYSRDSLGRFA